MQARELARRRRRLIRKRAGSRPRKHILDALLPLHLGRRIRRRPPRVQFRRRRRQRRRHHDQILRVPLRAAEPHRYKRLRGKRMALEDLHVEQLSICIPVVVFVEVEIAPAAGHAGARLVRT